MYGFSWRPAAPKGAGGADSVRPMAGNGSHGSSTSAVSNNSRKRTACSSERRMENVSKASSATAPSAARRIPVYCVTEPPTVAAALALAAYCPPKGASRGRTVRGTPASQSDAVRDYKGAAGSAVALGTQIFRRAAAGSSYLRGHSLRGRGISSRKIPPLQGEKAHLDEMSIAGEGDRGVGSQLVPLFKPDHTNDGPACTCLKALEPQLILSCSAGAYAGNYFFISKDAHGEVLGGGPRLGPLTFGGLDDLSDVQPLQQKKENGVMQQQKQRGHPRTPSVSSLREPLSGRQEHQKASLEDADDVPPLRQAHHFHLLAKQHDEEHRQKLVRREGEEATREEGAHRRLGARVVSTPCNPVWTVQKLERRHCAAPQQVEFSLTPGRPPGGARNQQPQRCGEKAEEIRQRQQPKELSPVGSTQFRDTSSDSSVTDGVHFHEEKADALQLLKKREDQRTSPFGASARQREDFTVADVTLRIEHEGLSAVHARIWEDPKRKHLEDRLIIEDLSSEEGTWKKVRWARAVPICRSSSSSPCSRSSLDSCSNVTQDDAFDGGEKDLTESEEAGREGENVNEEQEAARGTRRDDATEELSEVEQGSLSKESMRETTTTADTLMVGAVEDEKNCTGNVINADQSQIRAQSTGPGTLPSTTLELKGDKAEDADLWQDRSVSTTGNGPPLGMSAGGENFLPHAPQLEARRTRRCTRGARWHQGEEQPEGSALQQARKQLERGHIEVGETLLKQQEAEVSQGKALHTEIKSEERCLRKHPKEEKQYTEGRSGLFPCSEERVKGQAQSYQLVNFGGRLLRFERGSPLSPLEAFDEFLSTFELDHLKDCLLSCLRQRGCCCSRTLRGKTTSTASGTAASSPSAPGLRLRGLRRRSMIGTKVAVAGATTRNQEAAAATAELSSDTENISSVFTGCAGGARMGPLPVEADDLVASEVIWKGEGYRHWISRLRRDKVFPIQAAAFHTYEGCSPMLVDTRGCKETRWDALTTVGSRGSSGKGSVYTEHVGSESCAATLQVPEDVPTNSANKAGAQKDVEGNRDQSDTENGGTLRHLFKSDDKAKGRRACMNSGGIQPEDMRGSTVSAEVPHEKSRSRHEHTHVELKHLKNPLRLRRGNTYYRICSSCEANPLRWLWRSGPLSLIQEDAGICDPSNTRREAGEGKPSKAGRLMGTVEAKESVDEGDEPPRGTIAAVGAFGVCGRKAGTSSTRETMRRSLLFPEICRSEFKGSMCSHQDADGRVLSSCVRLSPEEAYRWRMACVALPRHFLPVCKKSRPLTIHDENTGTKLGEVRWSGCILVSKYEDQSNVSKSETAFPSATAATSAVTAAAAAQPQQQSCRLPAGAAEHHKQRRLSPDAKLCVEGLQQEQRLSRGEHPVAASIVVDPCQLSSEGLDDETGVNLRFPSNPSWGPTVVQATDPLAHTGVQTKSSCFHVEEKSPLFLETLSPTRGSKRSDFFEDQELHLPSSKTGTRAAVCEAALSENSSGHPGCVGNLTGSMNSNAGTLLNLEGKSTVRVPVYLAMLTSGSSALESTPARGSGSLSGRALQTKSRFKQEGFISNCNPGSPHVSTSDPQSERNDFEPRRNTSVNPLEDCDCWLLSSTVTQQRGRMLRGNLFALSSPGSREVAQAGTASCIQRKEIWHTNSSATPASAAKERAPTAGGTAKVAPILKETTATTVVSPFPETDFPTRVTQTKKRTSLTLRGAPSSAAAGRPPATSAAGSPAFTQTRADVAVLRKASVQQEPQEFMGENFTCGDEAPIEAVAQRLRTSSPSLLLQSRMPKEAASGITRTTPCALNVRSPTEVCGCLETIFPSTINTETDAVDGRCEGEDIRSITSETKETLKESQHQDVAGPQLKDYLGALAGGGAHPSTGQRCAASDCQQAGIRGRAAERTGKSYSFSFLPSPSFAATDTETETSELGKQSEKGRRWNIGVNDLLRWTSTTRRSSTGFLRNNTVHCAEGSTAASSSKAPASSCLSSRESSVLWETSVCSGATRAAAALCSGRPGTGGKSNSTDLGGKTLPGKVASTQESSVSSRPGLLKASTAPPSCLSSDRGSPHSSIRMRPVSPHATARNHDGMSACAEATRVSERNSRPKITTGRSLAMAAAAPVFAVVKSAASAVASVAPAALTLGIGSVSCTKSSAVTSAPAAVIPASADLSLSTTGSSFLAAPPALCPTLQTVPQSASLATLVRDSASAVPGHADAVIAGETRGPTCRVGAANGFFPDNAHAPTTVSAKADTVSEGAIASVRSGPPGISCDVSSSYTARTVGCTGALDGLAQSPVILSLFTVSSDTFPPGVSGRRFTPATVCHYPVIANAPAVETAVGGAFRSSRWRRRKSVYRRGRSACERQLGPRGAAGCSVRRPFLIESNRSRNDAPGGRDSINTRTGQPQRQNLHDAGSEVGELRQATTKTEAARAGNGPRRACSAVSLNLSGANCTTVEPAAQCADINFASLGGGRPPRKSDTEEHLANWFYRQRSSFAVDVEGAATGEMATLRRELRRSSSAVQGSGLSVGEGVTSTVNGQQMFLYREPGESDSDHSEAIPVSNVGGTFIITTRETCHPRVQLSGNGLVVGSRESSLAEEKCNVRVSTPRTEHTSASNGLDGTQRQPASDAQHCVGGTNPLCGAGERSHDTLIAGILHASDTSLAIQRPMVKHGGNEGAQIHSLPEEGKVALSHKRGTGAGLHEKDKRPPFSRRRCIQAATSAAVGSCSEKLVQPTTVFSHDIIRGEGEHLKALSQTSGLEQATAGTALPTCSAETLTRGEVSPIRQEPLDEKHLRLCTVGGRGEEAGGHLTHYGSTLLPSSPSLVPSEDLQENWLARLPLVHEARHRTSPDISSSDKNSEWSCSSENQEHVELSKRFSASSNASGVNSGKADEEFGRAQVEGGLVDATSWTRGKRNCSQQERVSVSEISCSAAARGLSRDAKTQVVGRAREASHARTVFEGEAGLRMTSSQDHGIGYESDVPKEQVSQPSKDSRTVASTGLPANIPAGGTVRLAEHVGLMKDGYFAVDSALVHCGAYATGQALSRETPEKSVMRLDQQEGLNTRAPHRAGVQGAAVSGESNLPFKTQGRVIDRIRSSATQDVRGFGAESREQQLQQERNTYDADKETSPADHWGSASDSSATADSGYKTLMRHPQLSPHCRADALPEGGTPEGKKELKHFFLSLESDLKAKVPPTPSMEGQVEDDEKKTQPFLLQDGVEVSLSATGRASGVACPVEKNKVVEWTDFTAEMTTSSGSSPSVQPRSESPTTCARDPSVENIDTNRNQQFERKPVKRNFFSFAGRPAAPLPKPPDADDEVSAPARESVYCVKSQCSFLSTIPDQSESQRQTALATDDLFVDVTRVDASVPVCWGGGAALNRSASCERSFSSRSADDISEGEPQSRCTRIGETRQHAGMPGHSVWGTNTTRCALGEGGTRSIPIVNVLDASVQGETRDGDAMDSLICSHTRREIGASRVSDARGAGADQNKKEQTWERQPLEETRFSVKRTEGKRTGAFTSLQLAAATQYVATRNRVAARLIRKQLSTGREEVSSKTPLEAELVTGRRLSTEGDEASIKRRGGRRIRLFPHKKCTEDRKKDARQGEVEGNNTCSRKCQLSEDLHDGSSSGGSESSNKAPGENQEHSIPTVAHVRVGKCGHIQNQRVSQVPGGNGEYGAKRVARIRKRITYLNSANRSTDGQKLKGVTLGPSGGSAPSLKLKFAYDKGRACSAVTQLRVGEENQSQLLLQAQAYLLRHVSRRQGFPEVVIPAAVNDKEHVLEAAWLEKNGEGLSGRTGCRGEAAASYEGTNNRPALSGRTIKPCYAHSIASIPRLGIVQESVTRSVPFLSSALVQGTLCEELRCGKGLYRETTAFQNSMQFRCRPPGLNEIDREFTDGDVCASGPDRYSNKVLCVYAAGRFQLLLAEPEDDNESCPSQSAPTTEATRAAVDAVGTGHSCISPSHWRTCSCWVRLHARRRYRLRPDDVLRVGPSLEFSLKRFLTGVSSQQGYRLSMEDEEVVIQDLGVAEDVYCSYFAVYDGHGGRACAEFVKRVLHVTFRQELLRMCGGSLSVSSTVRQHVYQALLSSFLATDAAFLREQQRRKRSGLLSTSGCACVVVVILGGEVWCANCGDARAVLCRGGKALELSSDHKPHRKDELQRIVAAGGFVRSKRVLGRLAVSRAFGDVDYKGARVHADSTSGTATALAPAGSTDPSALRTLSCTTSAFITQNGCKEKSSDTTLQVFDASSALVTAVPEIRMQSLCEEDEFLLLACDGLFDVFTSQEAADFVREALNGKFAEFKNPQILVDALLYEAIEKRKSRDNVTAILVFLSPKKRSFAVASSETRPPLQ